MRALPRPALAQEEIRRSHLLDDGRMDQERIEGRRIKRIEEHQAIAQGKREGTAEEVQVPPAVILRSEKQAFGVFPLVGEPEHVGALPPVKPQIGRFVVEALPKVAGIRKVERPSIHHLKFKQRRLFRFVGERLVGHEGLPRIHSAGEHDRERMSRHGIYLSLHVVFHNFAEKGLRRPLSGSPPSIH